MVGVSAISSQVLLVGDTGARLEGELAMHGLACAKAPTANDAVARMKTTRFPFVVVSPILADMGGVDFIHGVLRHFDASVVLYGNGIEINEINALLRTGRVAHFPGNVEGQAVADFLARRAGSATPTPMPRPPVQAPALAGSIPGAPSPFNLTPGAASLSSPPVFSGASPSLAPLSPVASFGSFPPQPTSSLGSFPPFAASPLTGSSTPRPATLGPTPGFRRETPHPTVPAFGSQSIGTDHLAAQQQPPSPQPQRELLMRLEGMADELARANSELARTRAQVGALDQEKAALLVEVEAARRSALADVAQVMALSDEGLAIDTELEDTKARLTSAVADAERVASELESVRQERERLMAEMAEASGRLAEATAGRDAAEAQLVELQRGGDRGREDVAAARAELEKVRMELDGARADLSSARVECDAIAERARLDVLAVEGALKVERSARSEAEAKLAAFRIENDEKWAAALAEESERAIAAEERSDILENQRNDLAQALADTEAKAGSGAEVESALRIELDKLRADVAGARTDATTVRLDLQEALLRLEEANGGLQSLTVERDTLRDEAGPLREWGNLLVAAHAHQQGELEHLRRLLEAAAAHEATIAALQQQLAAAPSAPPPSGEPASADVEVLLARSRQLADLVRALEPFMWGLTQATAFYKEQQPPASGSEAHLRSLQQLQGVLLRLRDEIAMLDLG